MCILPSSADIFKASEHLMKASNTVAIGDGAKH